MSKEFCIQSVSVCDSIKIHFFSFVFGIWVLFKKLAQWFWNHKRTNSAPERDNPPSCLIDVSLGQHKYVKLKGVKFHYVESGPKDQSLILLLHGFPDFWLSWRYQIPVLSQHFRVVALDLKGFGDSDKPMWRTCYKIDKILEEIEDFVNALGVSECIIIGHDLGALIGWYLVHHNPMLVKKFFAVSCPHPNVYWQNLTNTRSYHWLNFVQVPYLPEIDALKEDVKIINQYHKHLPNKDIYLEAYKYTFSRQEDWTGPINYYRNLPFLKINEESDNVSTQVILITGNKDKLIKLEGVVKSTEFCERFHMKIIDGCEHFPHQENPNSFNRVLIKYLIPKKTEFLDRTTDRFPSNRLVQGILGAVSNTMKYGNNVMHNVQKRTNVVVGNIPTMSMLPNYIHPNS